MSAKASRLFLGRIAMFLAYCAPVIAGPPIELSDEIIVEQSNPEQNVVILLDDSHSMNSPPKSIIHPDTGQLTSFWDYIEEPLLEIFSLVKNANVAIGHLNAVAQPNRHERVLLNIDGKQNNGNPNPHLSNAISEMFHDGTSHGTPTREAMLNAGRFLLCDPGTDVPFLRGGHNPAGAPNYQCWNKVDFNTDPQEKKCVSHSLWLISDGNFTAIGQNNEVQDFFDTHGVDRETDNIFEPSTFPFEHFPTGVSDVAAHIIEQAKQKNIDLDFHYVMLNEQRIAVKAAHLNTAYDLSGTGTSVINTKWLEQICALRGEAHGLPRSCNNTDSDKHWDWLPRHYHAFDLPNSAIGPRWAPGSTMPTIFDFTHVTYNNLHTTTWDEAAAIDHALANRHFKEAGMLASEFASEPAQFHQAIPRLMQAIEKLDISQPSRGGIATNGTESTDPTSLYQPYYSHTASDVYHWTLPNVGQSLTNAHFNASAANSIPVGVARTLWSMNASRTPFLFPDPNAPSTDFQDAFDGWFSNADKANIPLKERINWIRNEDIANLRTRSPTNKIKHPVTKTATPSFIGDIIHSKPIVVGQAFFNARPTAKSAYQGSPSYRSFKSSVATRQPMLYVGSNGGLLHAFDANTMEERFAYMPSNKLLRDNQGHHTIRHTQDPAYIHRYGVDMSPVVQDVLTDTNCPGLQSRCWRTVLAAGLRKGGRGYFMLDVTDPTVFNAAATGAEHVMWEYSTSDYLGNQLGFSYSDIAVHASHWRKNSKPRWTAAFGNGLLSQSGNAYLYILSIDKTSSVTHEWNSSNVVRIQAGIGYSNNGLLSPVGADIDNDDIIDVYYAGDVLGNLWRFNVADPDPAQWSAHKLFSSSSSSTRVAIATRPVVVRHKSEDGLMVVFGTGHLYNREAYDDLRKQGLYGVWDQDPYATGHTAFTKADLLRQRWRSDTVGALEVRGFSKSESAPDYSYHKGWFVSLVDQGGIKRGERITSLSIHQNLIVATSQMVDEQSGSSSQSACSDIKYGGYVSLFDPTTGGADIDIARFSHEALDTNSEEPGSNVITSFKLNLAPSPLAFSRRNTMHFQDNEGTIKEVLLEGGGYLSLSQRLSWTELRHW